MTKEITKSYILQQLEEKFKLREFEPAVFSFMETVVPIYDIGQHLRSTYGKHTRITVGSMGAKIFYTIPQDEKWFVNGYTVIFVSGVFTIAGVYVARAKAPTVFVYLDLAAAQNTSYTMNLPKTLVMEPGDTLCVNVDGFTSVGNLDVEIDCEYEVIR